jgi:hypothetical protein
VTFPDVTTFSIYAPAFPPTVPSARRVYLALRGAVVRRWRGHQDCHVALRLTSSTLDRGPAWMPARYDSKAAFNPTPVLSFAWKHC